MMSVTTHNVMMWVTFDNVNMVNEIWGFLEDAAQNWVHWLSAEHKS